MFIMPLTTMADAAMLGVGIAIALNTKNKEQRAKVSSACVSGVAGVTEPIVYGTVLPNPKLFIPVLINASIFGAIMGI
jgi:phosphotransferase system  glucose/maltose/N-acetylglucosamine-specific IIC component